ncbi:uncharacterized protein LOC113511925 isoform X2 [Galleria mellonella]|uniref:Uncharacterized protein LOC113511925 isoform X2 n=1 Tax=Galleria mellonella TaxID=7137 RepID=A0ABM3MQI2_GALME|nr:uncharacterized protein LOC113511925 isoform X2 [Galleria mellonella]
MIIIFQGKLPMSRNIKAIYDKLLETEKAIDDLLDGDNKAFQVLLLHQYNDIKDATQIVINHIANLEDTTITEVHERLQLNNE